MSEATVIALDRRQAWLLFVDVRVHVNEIASKEQEA